MGCNAWNHASNCNCGWGGIGHKGRRSASNSFGSNPPIIRTYRDLQLGFTIPNVHCPVCGVLVFFYTSPYDGRVFFDSLGPPWPKHGCTDTGQPLVYTSDTSKTTELPVDKAANNSWLPSLCLSIESTNSDKSIQKLSGYIHEDKKTLFVRVTGLSEHAPFVIQVDEQKYIWLSTVISDRGQLTSKQFRAFEFESDLRSLLTDVKSTRNVSRIRLFNPSKSQDSDATASSIEKNKKKLLQCVHCSESVKNLTRHLKYAHGSRPLIKCNDCGVMVKDLKAHFLKLHSPEAIQKTAKRVEVENKRKQANRNKKAKLSEISQLAKIGQCPFCSFKTRLEMELVAHLNAKHQKSATVLLHVKPD